LQEVLGRWRRYGKSWHPAAPRHFNPDTFEKHGAAHNKAFKIAASYPEREATIYQGVIAQQKQQVILRNVATFQENFFLKGPMTGCIISVSSAAMRDVMLRRNFVEVRCDHFMDPAQLPTEEMRST